MTVEAPEKRRDKKRRVSQLQRKGNILRGTSYRGKGDILQGEGEHLSGGREREGEGQGVERGKTFLRAALRHTCTP